MFSNNGGWRKEFQYKKRTTKRERRNEDAKVNSTDSPQRLCVAKQAFWGVPEQYCSLILHLCLSCCHE